MLRGERRHNKAVLVEFDGRLHSTAIQRFGDAMQATYDELHQNERPANGYLLPLLAGGLVLLFLAAPWPLAHKAHAALHGLCAQTPSHTFHLGSQALPFDARMTGIYGGFLATFHYLLATGRHRAAKLPSWGVIAVLTLLVGVMAIDGFNSLFLDMGQPHPYEPDNRLRLATGMGAGLALAMVICYLFGVTLWRRPKARVRVAGWRDLALILPLQLPFGLAILSGAGWLAIPITLLLIGSAVTVVSALALIAIVLVRQRDFSFDGFGDLQPSMCAAVVAAVVVMAMLSGGRFALERALGIPPLT